MYSVDNPEQIAVNLFGIQGEVTPLAGYVDKNFLVEAGNGKKYVLKLSREPKELLPALPPNPRYKQLYHFPPQIKP